MKELSYEDMYEISGGVSPADLLVGIGLAIVAGAAAAFFTEWDDFKKGVKEGYNYYAGSQP